MTTEERDRLIDRGVFTGPKSRKQYILVDAPGYGNGNRNCEARVQATSNDVRRLWKDAHKPSLMLYEALGETEYEIGQYLSRQFLGGQFFRYAGPHTH